MMALRLLEASVKTGDVHPVSKCSSCSVHASSQHHVFRKPTDDVRKKSCLHFFSYNFSVVFKLAISKVTHTIAAIKALLTAI